MGGIDGNEAVYMRQSAITILQRHLHNVTFLSQTRIKIFYAAPELPSNSPICKILDRVGAESTMILGLFRVVVSVVQSRSIGYVSCLAQSR